MSIVTAVSVNRLIKPRGQSCVIILYDWLLPQKCCPYALKISRFQGLAPDNPVLRTRDMEKTIQTFDNHEAADRANADFYRSLSTTQRLEIALELMRPHYEAACRLQRVYRTCQLGESL